MQTKNIYLQIANECFLGLQLICFVFLVELNRSKSLSLKQTEIDKTDSLDIFGSFILSVKGKSTKLGILQAFLQHYFKEQIEETNILISFSVKLRIYI